VRQALVTGNTPDIVLRLWERFNYFLYNILAFYLKNNIDVKQLDELMSELNSVLLERHSPILDKLQKGLNSITTRKLLGSFNITNDKLVTLFGWRNGVKDMYNGSKIEEFELFPEAIMLSLEEAINHYKVSIEQKLWEGGLFPMFSNGGGDYLLFDCNKNSVSYEVVLLYAPSLLLNEKPESIYDSIENLIQTVINCFNQKAYKFDVKGLMDVDYDLKYKISTKLNPNSSYWDEYR